MESKLIEFDNDGKIITATGNVEIKVENGIIIKSDKSILNKEDSILEASGNIYFLDEMPSKLSVGSIISISVFSIFVTTLASLLPSLSVTKIETIKALKYE